MVGWTFITNKYQSQQVNNKCEHNSQGPRNIEKLSSNKTCFMALSRWEPRRAGTRTISHPGFLWSPRRYCSLWADPVLQPTDWHVRQEWHAEGKEINSNPRNFTLEFPVETLPIKPGFSPAPKFTGYIHVPWWFGVCAICKQNCILKSHTPSHWPNLTTLGGLGVCWEARQLSPEVKVMCSSFKSLKMPTCKLDFFWNSAIRNLSETLLFDGSAAYAAVSPGRRCSLWSCRWFCHDLITAVPHSSVYWHTRSIGCSPCWTPPPSQMYSSQRYDHVTPHVVSCTGWGWVSGSTTNWQFLSTAASTAWLRRTSPTTSTVWRTWTPGGLFARHQRAHSSCLWRACQQSETARFRWPRLACGTVCRPISLRRHRCRHSRDGWRQNCLFGAIHSSATSDTLFFTARTSFRFVFFVL